MADKKTEVKEKLKAGSSIPAQCKFLVSAIATELRERLVGDLADITPAELLGEAISEQLFDVAEQIASTAQRGLPLSTRLENVQKEIAAHYMAITNDTAKPDAEWDATTTALITKRKNVERLIENAKKTESPEPEKSETTAA